jgi:hypothetical protein
MNRLYVFLATLLPVASGTACGSDPQIIVPNEFHGKATLVFCAPSSSSTTIELAADGSATSGICDHDLRKFSIKRANGETIRTNSQTETTGDGYVVRATFTIP